jgi:predicted HTH transcriptional regulator
MQAPIVWRRVWNSGDILGIDSECIAQIKKDFVTALNNPQKISPPAYLSVDEVQIQGKTILHIFVPENSQVHRCNGRIFDRNEDGDFDITDHTRLVSDLYHRKQAQSKTQSKAQSSERGIQPERLPPEEDITKLERRVKSDERKLEKQSGKLPELNE